MRLYVLDTDISGFVQNEHPTVTARINALPDDDTVATTVVTFGEDLSGWLPACRRARNGQARAGLRAIDGWTRFLPRDDLLAIRWRDGDDLRSVAHAKIRIGTNDLAIAAITLSVNGILVMRNAVDFQRIPDLLFEDWTK